MPRLDLHTFFGLDLGRRQDPSAISILERRHDYTGHRDPTSFELDLKLRFVLRHVETFPLGTHYFEIVRRIRDLIRDSGQLKTLVVDASGVGAPIVEAFRAVRLGASLIPITITGSGHPHPDPHGGYLVPRRDLISNLRIMMERGLLRIPPAIHAKEALVKELIHLKDHQGNHHDDLAISLTLAAWQATRGINHLIGASIDPSCSGLRSR
jgi:hypothetical protein